MRGGGCWGRGHDTKWGTVPIGDSAGGGYAGAHLCSRGIMHCTAATSTPHRTCGTSQDVDARCAEQPSLQLAGGNALLEPPQPPPPFRARGSCARCQMHTDGAAAVVSCSQTLLGHARGRAACCDRAMMRLAPQACCCYCGHTLTWPPPHTRHSPPQRARVPPGRATQHGEGVLTR